LCAEAAELLPAALLIPGLNPVTGFLNGIVGEDFRAGGFGRILGDEV